MKKILMMVVFFLVFSVCFNVSTTESTVNKVSYDIEKTVIDEMNNNYDYECINCGYIFRMSKKG